MMTFDSPAWLLLLVPVVAVLVTWKMPSRILQGLRATAAVLLVLAMSVPVVRYHSSSGVVVVVTDRSLSMPHDTEDRATEVIDLLQGDRRSGDRLAVVAFGRKALVEQPPQEARFPGFAGEVERDGSNLAGGIETALSLVPAGTPGRILVISDGRWTGVHPVAAVSQATSRGVSVDYRLVQRPTTGDVAVSDIEVPEVVGPGSAYFITAHVESPRPQRIRYQLVRDDRIIAEGTREVTAGSNRLTFRDVASSSGVGQYRLNVSTATDGAEAVRDPVPENNSARFMVGVHSPRPVLHVTETDRSNLTGLLRKGGLEVVHRRASDCRWQLEDLARYTAVILENVPVDRLNVTGMENLATWVRQTGAGLMVTGGKSSYAVGGYYQSPLDPIMPVSMELRTEHRKLRLAIVVVLDRSGSMSMAVGGRTKMDLANLGTAEVLRLLSHEDEFGCLAVDSSPHTIVPLDKVGNLGGARRKVLGIQSMGGGIFVYTGLKQAAGMIAKASAGTRHIVLFSDAADSEEPGQYKLLLDKLNKAGITVSVIGLGRRTDPDAAFLIDVARRGNGRIFFTDQATQLPRLFAQDTFTVARSTFIEDPTAVKKTPLLDTLAGNKVAAVPRLGGYNLCYLKPEASLGLVSQDEYKAPVVAWWQAGTGRVLCYTGEVDGKFTGPIARWSDVGTFLTSLAAWTAGDPRMLPGNMLVTQRQEHGVCTVKLELDPQRTSQPLRTPPVVTVMRGQAGSSPKVEKVPMKWTSPDELSLEVPLEGTETVLATVDVEGVGRSVLWPTCLPYSPEFRPADVGHGGEVLETLARGTGGVNRTSLEGTWDDLQRKPRYVSLGPWLVSLAVVVFVLEILQRRTGALLMAARAVRRAVRRRRRGTRRTTTREEKPESTTRVKRRKRTGTETPPEQQSTRPAEEPAEPEAPESTRPPARGGMLDALKQVRKRSEDRSRK